MSQKLPNNIIKDNLGVDHNLNNVYALCDVSSETGLIYLVKKYKTKRRMLQAYHNIKFKNIGRFEVKMFKVNYQNINNFININYESIEH